MSRQQRLSYFAYQFEAQIADGENDQGHLLKSTLTDRCPMPVLASATHPKHSPAPQDFFEHSNLFMHYSDDFYKHIQLLC